MLRSLFYLFLLPFALQDRTFAEVPEGPPAITSINPTSGNPGTSVTIAGSGFSPTAASNTVFFGATKATVTTASTTSLTVAVPSGATYGPISVNVGGRIGLSAQFFLPTFVSTVPGIDATTLAAKVDFATGDNPISMAIGDVDGDGKPDVAVLDSPGLRKVSVYRNTSVSGTIDAFSLAPKVDFAAGGLAEHVTMGDVDGDDKLDLVVTNRASTFMAMSVSVLRNTSTPGVINASSFAAKVDFATGIAPASVAVGDGDGDGKLDLAVTNHGDRVSVLRNTSTPGVINTSSFAAKVDFATGGSPRDVAMGDVDGDGKLDLLVSHYGENTVSVYRNTATTGMIDASSFAAKVNFPTGEVPTSLAIGDVDGDGKLDLTTTNYHSKSISVLRNTSTSGVINASSFAAKVDFAAGIVPNSVAMGDLDGDAKPDLVVTNQRSNSVSVYRNTATPGTISAVSLAERVDFGTGTFPVSVEVEDVDGDGRPDLVVANNASNTLSIFRNQAGAAPSAPSPSSPADGASAQPLSLTLSWDTASGATAYHLQVSTDANFASMIFDHAALANPSQAVGPLSDNTAYYWRVRASNAHGTGAYSAARSFTTVSNAVLVATAQTVSGNEDTDLAITLAGTGADGQVLSAVVSALPANGALYQTPDGATRGAQITAVPTAVTNALKRVIYAPLANGNGAGYGNFGFKINDGLVDSPQATVTVNVTAINDPPVLSLIGAKTVNGRELLSFTLVGSDLDRDVLTYTVSSLPTGATLSGPTFSWTPSYEQAGSYRVIFAVSDGKGGTADEPVTITVNPPPRCGPPRR